MQKLICLLAATATTATTTFPNFERRILTTLKIDVVDDDTGVIETSVLRLRDGDIPAEAAVSFCADAVSEPSPDCATVLHEALEAMLQQRIDNVSFCFLSIAFFEFSLLTNFFISDCHERFRFNIINVTARTWRSSLKWKQKTPNPKRILFCFFTTKMLKMLS